MITCQDDFYYKDWSDKDFDEMINSQIKQGEYKNSLNVEATIITALSNLEFLRHQDISNESVKKKRMGCYDLIKAHIKNGFNIYPLIDRLNHNVEEHKKKFTKECEKGGRFYDRMVSDMNSVQTLELLEMSSPYVQFINASNQLGELIREQKDLEKLEKYDDAQAIDDKIQRIKEQLNERFKSYDTDFLEQFLTDRKNYLRKDQNKIDEFRGALEVAKTLMFYKKRENSLSSEK